MECVLAHSCAQRSCSTKKAPTPNRNESSYSLNHLYDILTYAFPVTEENPAQLTRHSIPSVIFHDLKVGSLSACNSGVIFTSMLLVPAHTCRRLSETFIRSYCLCLRLYPLCNHSTNLFVCQPLKTKILRFVYRGFCFLYHSSLFILPCPNKTVYTDCMNICTAAA